MAMPAKSMSTPSINPLNPTLYGLLEHKFGDVKIANPGCAANIQKFADPLRPGKVIQQAQWWGEYYCVHCPFCNDMGHKLWINHLYGSEYNERTGRRSHTFLAHCYKNSCLAVAGRSQQLEDMIFGPGRRYIKTMAIRSGETAPALEVLEPPGEIVSLLDLPIDHPACEYLWSRGFDVGELAEVFSLGVCVQAKPRYRIMQDRIYIPAHFQRELVVWQGRLCHQPTGKNEIKYYTQGKKSRALYNYDVACLQPFAVVVEGCPSVWRLGRVGVALFGNTMSHWQENTIATTWAGKPVFVVLDYGADAELEKIATQLCRHNVSLIPMIMPDARDPADYSRAELRDMLHSAAKSVGVDVDLNSLR